MRERLEEEELKRRLGGGPARVGQVLITRSGGSIRVEGPPGEREAVSAPAGRAAFRRWIRTTDDGAYRPLTGAKNLRTGWQVACDSVAEAAGVVEGIYPLALRHAALHRAGRLHVVSWEASCGRQRGPHARAPCLSEAGRGRAVGALCGQCVREPLWHRTVDRDRFPCPQPCSAFLALADAAAGWEKNPPRARAADPRAGFADFDHPGNATRNRFLAG